MGKGGSSSNSSSQQTINTDKRMVIDGGSIGISSDQSTVTVNNTTSDYGAIRAALEAASANNTALLNTSGKMVDHVIDANGSAVNRVLDSADRSIGRTFDAQGNLIDAGKSLFDTAFSMIDKNMAMVQASEANVANAYETAKSLEKSSENKFLVTVGMAVVGIAAVAAFGRK